MPTIAHVCGLQDGKHKREKKQCVASECIMAKQLFSFELLSHLFH